MKTIAHIAITPKHIVLNGMEMKVLSEGANLLTAVYRHYINDYPKFFKMDGLCKLGFIASELLLASMDEKRFVARNDRAVVLFNCSGSHETDKLFHSTISTPDNCFPSPSLFVYTLSNIVTGEIAIRNKYHAETGFYVITNLNEEFMDTQAEMAFKDETVRSVLTGWIDYIDENNFNAHLKVIKKDA